MTAGLWLLAALVGVAVAAWAYGTREERVSGRAGPAALRAAALFLIVGGLALPALRGGGPAAPGPVALLDVSRSMTLPVRADDPAAPVRLDSALTRLAELAPSRVYLFGDDVVAARIDGLDSVMATHNASRLLPALRAAQLGGADSVWVLTDGGLADRDRAVEEAERIGLGVRELRVAEAVPRAGLIAMRAPRRAQAGDTLRVALEFRVDGDPDALPDSVAFRIESGGEVVATAQAPRPAPGRVGRTEVAFVAGSEGGSPEWRRYEAVLANPADPLGAAGQAVAWVEVTGSAAGAVLLSTVPSWDARFLVPTIDRLARGGVRAFQLLGDGRFLELGPRPRIVDESVARTALSGASLLAVHAEPERIPEWVAGELRSHPRALFFAAGAGEIPGLDVRTTGPLPGEWYPVGPVPPSPSSALLAGAVLDELPPVRELYAAVSAASEGRPVIDAARNRRGEGRSLLTVWEDGERRWAVAGAADWWRWSLRGGGSKRVYDGIFGGVVNWLVEDAEPELVSLVRSPAAGEAPLWRVRAGTTELSIRLLKDGAEVWSDSSSDPAAEVAGPPLAAGLYEAEARATGPAGTADVRYPIEVVLDPAEFIVPAHRAPIVTEAAAGDRRPDEMRRPRPVWPFLVAALILCCEWIWRNRIGLR